MTNAISEPVYAIAQLVVKDMVRYFEEYAKPLTEINRRHGAEILAATPTPNVLEGDYNRNFTVILKFPSEEAQIAWYKDPDYQPLIEKRQSLTDLDVSTLIVVPKFQPPS